MGGVPVCEAQAAAKDFMRWFEDYFAKLHHGEPRMTTEKSIERW
jgi:hypothetical protein